MLTMDISFENVTDYLRHGYEFSIWLELYNLGASAQLISSKNLMHAFNL